MEKSPLCCLYIYMIIKLLTVWHNSGKGTCIKLETMNTQIQTLNRNTIKTELTTTLVLIFSILIFSIQLNAETKTSVSNGDWSKSSVWSPSGSPKTGDKIKIYHRVTLDQNFTAQDTIFIFKTLNIEKNKVLTLSPGTMILVNDKTYDGKLGTIENNANVLGNFTFQKWIDRCDGSSMYGSPFNVLTSDFNWYYCNNCMPNWSNIYAYDESLPGDKNNGYYDQLSGKVNRGQGFFYWFKNYNGGPNFSRKISLKGSINFKSDFNFNVTRTTSSVTSDDGFNLVSNPFPGTIDWLSSGWTKSRIVNAFYVWNTCTESYSSFSGGVGVNGGSRYIPSMQGFWVQASSNNPKLSVSSEVMVDRDGTELLRTTSTKEPNFVLRLTLGGDEIAIRVDSNSTENFEDSNDAIKFYSDNSRLSSQTSIDTSDYSINTVSDKTPGIPVKTKGSGTLSFSGVNTFLGEYKIYVKDLITNNTLEVTEGMELHFTDTSKVTFNKRFEITFIKKLLLVSTPGSILGSTNGLGNTTGISNEKIDNIKIWYDSDNIHVSLPSEIGFPVKVTFISLLGSELQSIQVNEKEFTLPRMTEPTLLRVQNGTSTYVKKVF